MTEAALELIVPLVIASMIDNGIKTGDRHYIMLMGIQLAVLAVTGLVVAVTAQYLSAVAGTGFGAKLRAALFRHIQTLSYTELDRLGTSTLITRLTSDVLQTQTAVNMFMRLFLRSPFIVFGAMIMAFTIDVKSALIFTVAIPVLAVIIFGIKYVTMPLFGRVQSGVDTIMRRTRENVIGVRVIRAFRMEEKEKETFREDVDSLASMQKYAGKITALMNPLSYIVVNGATAALLYIGASQVDTGALSQGDVTAILNYMSQILIELVKLANLIIMLTKGSASARRINEVFGTQSSMKDGTLSEGAGGEYAVELRGVSMRYAGAAEEELSGIDLRVRKGQTVGIIGGTGSGKSTLVNLLPRFYDVSEGCVLVDGTDVREYKLSELRSKFGIVPQKAELFNASIRDNIRMGREDASDDEIMAALETAQALDVINAKASGLDEMIEEGGANLSGGQKQRLTIARALVRRPEILILDDSASALDLATDLKLRAAIKNMPDAPVTFIVSQRTSAIRYADIILVLDDGRPAGTGTHEQLLESCGVYREIYYSQYGESEAA